MSVSAIPNPKKTIQVDFPIERVKLSVKNINLINSKYTFSSSNEIFNQYTYSALELLSLGVYVDINLNNISEFKTEITVEIRRKIGSFNDSYEITKSNDHIVSIYDCIAKLTCKSPEEIENLKNEQIEKLKPSKKPNNLSRNNSNTQTSTTNAWYEKKWLVIFLCVVFFPVGLYGLWKNTTIANNWKFAITSLIAIIIIASWGDNSKIGKYTKEELPKNFSYDIIKDESNEVLEKNQLYVELSGKLTEGQIATLAEELFNSKKEERRFYMFYQLKGVENNVSSWATSHFDPELEIVITGSTTAEDVNKDKLSEKIEGEVIGKWDENKYTFSNLIIYKKGNKTFIKTVFKNGQTSDVELEESKTEKGIRFDYKDGGYNGEYFILNNENRLELYNSENKNFTTATPK
ncbi:hypothetical protein [Flavobacterium soyangense]|uniref:Uncharacterized protein n=1 Tax=Flavobacterium soyangense TaxID=2023265 RepID=A0A930UEW0_9FLAO|nr:hypothetical protein [Flavobacterium soyangense]MBF2710021.1 hypothetical protein [Flavobacterium soyangense]